MGEHEGTNMIIMWQDNVLLRLDAFYYRVVCHYMFGIKSSAPNSKRCNQQLKVPVN